MLVKGELILTKNDVNKVEVEKLSQILTVRNPEAENRFSRWKEVPETLSFIKIGRFVKIPRNFFAFSDIAEQFPKLAEQYRKLSRKYISGSMSIQFKGSLRDYQKEYLRDVPVWGDKIITASPGTGKTAIALWNIAQIQMPALILVPTNLLADQWLERCQTFFSGVVCSKSTARRIAWEDADLLILTYDLFNAREWPYSFFQKWGIVVVDEGRLTGAPSYLPIISQFPAPNRILLDGTFRRKDGMDKILAYHFGECYPMESPFPKPSVYFYDREFTGGFMSKVPDGVNWKEFLHFAGCSSEEISGYAVLHTPPNESKVAEYQLKKLCNKTQAKKLSRFVKGFYKTSVSTVDTVVAEHPKYRLWLSFVVQQCIEAGRFPLVLSKRKSVLYWLEKELTDLGYKPSLIVAGVDYKPGSDCVLGINQLAEYGLDIDSLDTLIFVHPSTDVEQAFGRIRRTAPGKKSPLVICPVPVSLYLWLWKKGEEYITPNAKEVFTISSLKYLEL